LHVSRGWVDRINLITRRTNQRTGQRAGVLRRSVICRAAQILNIDACSMIGGSDRTEPLETGMVEDREVGLLFSPLFYSGARGTCMARLAIIPGLRHEHAN
jgi:hypothetical protein